MTGRLVIMGSGESAPTMVKVHRALIEESGAGARAMLDTPFGFQANADDLTDKLLEYFAAAVGVTLEVARWRRRDESTATRERALALLQRSSYVFAGPGSPSYALKQWQDTPVPRSLTDVVHRGGTVVLGSAAAATVGSHAVPVYEIYKVGDDPHWLPGIDLLGQLTGISAAVIPHFDNREGGRHDTRYCYLGEARLTAMEALLPSGVGVLGVDEHTAVILDIDTALVTVQGAGGLTLRRGGSGDFIPAGESIALGDLAAVLAGTARPSHHPVPVQAPVDGPAVAATSETSLRATAEDLRRRFDVSLAAGDSDGAAEACLDLEDAVRAWSADTLQSDDIDIARQVLRSMIVDLAGAAASGLRDPREVVGPIVQVALDARQRARDARDFATSDVIRDALGEAGIEVRDTPAGMEWEIVAR